MDRQQELEVGARLLAVAAELDGLRRDLHRWLERKCDPLLRAKKLQAMAKLQAKQLALGDEALQYIRDASRRPAPPSDLEAKSLPEVKDL
jgi:hypothetical protein